MLAYNVREVRKGEVKWVRRTKKLTKFCDEYRTVASVRPLAEDILSPLNSRLARPESTQTVASFIRDVYLPHCKQNLRPSTYHGYAFLFKMIEDHFGEARLRNFDTVESERLLTDFATEKQRAHTVIKNTKAFLSGAFRYAVRTGTIRFNPMREVMLPRNGTPIEDGYAYSLEEIQAMLKVLPEPARTAVLIAALTSLRLSEIRGLKWTDFTGDELHVRRSVWESQVVEATKTPASNAPVPVVPMLREGLEEHRKTSTSEYILAGGTGRPLVLKNVTRRDIRPTLKEKKIAWHGWHAFRRGLASNLNRLGVDDSIIQKILRHSSVTVTQQHYIKTTAKESQAAMKKLERAFKKAGRSPNRGPK